MRSQQLKILLRLLHRLSYAFLIALWSILTVDIVWSLISNRSSSSAKLKLPVSGGINYLIIAPQALADSASAWADYRNSTGYNTNVVLLAPDQARVEIIWDRIQTTYAESGKPFPFYVLLIGHAHPLSSNPDTFLPAAYFTVDQTRTSSFGTDPIASDDGYAGINYRGIPDHNLPIFIGRIPIRTEEEGFLLLKRTQNYEMSSPTGEGRARIDLVTSNAGFGTQYDPIFDWALRMLIQRLLPGEYQWHLLNGNADSPYSYPIHLFPYEVARRLDSGSLALVYIGHGQPEMLCCASSLNGEPGRIFGPEDAGLMKSTNTSLGIFTACSAGIYDQNGDNLSVVESIYLTPGGPVATYSSSAWINGTMNGRLLLDIFEALLIDKPSTLGEWVGLIESWPVMVDSHTLITAMTREILPRVSGVYQKNPLLSPTQANQELDIQHATYNLFGDPALRIAYPQTGIKVSPTWLWQPGKDSLAFSGKSNLPLDQEVSISLEIIPGSAISQEDQPTGMIDRYHQANNLVIGTTTLFTDKDGRFTGSIMLPPNITSGKYLLRAVSILNKDTFVAFHPVYIGFPPIIDIFSSAVFWWALVTILLSYKSMLLVQHHA